MLKSNYHGDFGTAEATAKRTESGEVLSDKEGKYLFSSLGAEQSGLETLKVRDTIGYADVTVGVQTPEHVEGITNLPGLFIPVVDLRAIFGMDAT
jgi:chemotaxis signal transduction protein